MSNALWPTLPGLAWGITRVPNYSTKVQRAVSGAELRAAFYSAPIQKWTLSYAFLRSGAGYNELQTIVAFFKQRQGSFDSFLFNDPDDNNVTAHGFGMGDGVKAQFQLQRADLGTFVDNALLPANITTITTPRTNVCLQSNNAAAWTNYTSGTGVAAVKTADNSYAPDGSLSADRVVLDRGAGNTASDYSGVTSPANAGATAIGQVYTQSVWLRTTDGSTKTVRLTNASSFGQNVTVTGEWQRFAGTYTATLTNHQLRILTLGGSGTTQQLDLQVWGSQLERGAIATDFIPTATVSVTQSPAYWPASSDGFEPVYTLNQTQAAVRIYIDTGAGPVLQTLGTHYSINSSGMVTFTTPPPANAALTWTGAYYWRVRFAIDHIDFANFLYQLYELKKVELVTSR